MEKLLKFGEFITENADTTEVDNINTDGIDNVDMKPLVSTVTIDIRDVNQHLYDNLIKKLTKFCKGAKLPIPISTKIDDVTKYLVIKKSRGEYQSVGIFDTLSDISQYKNEKNYFIRPYEFIRYELKAVVDIKPNPNYEYIGSYDYVDELASPAFGKQIPHNLITNLKGTSYCTRCKKTIKRNRIIFVKNLKTNEIETIGGNCIAYYLSRNYDNVLKALDTMQEIIKSSNDIGGEDWEGSYGGGGGNMPITYSANDIIRYYLGFVKKNNYHISKKAADEFNSSLAENDTTTKRKESTGEIIKDKYIATLYEPVKQRNQSYADFEYEFKKWIEEYKEYEVILKTTSDDEYNECVDFIKSKSDDSNFMFNASNVISKDYFTSSKALSILCGACSYFISMQFSKREKELRDAEKNKINGASNYLGTVGEKMPFINVKITNIRGFETAFGYSHVYTMMDDSGNIIIKFGTIGEQFLTSGDEVAIGSTLSFISDIKEHKEFNGAKQTVIGRLSKLKK